MASSALGLELIRLSCNLSAVACPGCDEILDVQQPDARRPDRLLGICPSCSAWFFINADAEVMFHLPTDDDARVA